MRAFSYNGNRNIINKGKQQKINFKTNKNLVSIKEQDQHGFNNSNQFLSQNNNQYEQQNTLPPKPDDQKQYQCTFEMTENGDEEKPNEDENMLESFFSEFNKNISITFEKKQKKYDQLYVSCADIIKTLDNDFNKSLLFRKTSNNQSQNGYSNKIKLRKNNSNFSMPNKSQNPVKQVQNNMNNSNNALETINNNELKQEQNQKAFYSCKPNNSKLELNQNNNNQNVQSNIFQKSVILQQQYNSQFSTSNSNFNQSLNNTQNNFNISNNNNKLQHFLKNVQNEKVQKNKAIPRKPLKQINAGETISVNQILETNKNNKPNFNEIKKINNGNNNNLLRKSLDKENLNPNISQNIFQNGLKTGLTARTSLIKNGIQNKKNSQSKSPAIFNGKSIITGQQIGIEFEKNINDNQTDDSLSNCNFSINNLKLQFQQTNGEIQQEKSQLIKLQQLYNDILVFQPRDRYKSLGQIGDVDKQQQQKLQMKRGIQNKRGIKLQQLKQQLKNQNNNLDFNEVECSSINSSPSKMQN
ncbi:hypothetical protein PPERSA_08501 [Pseudocohnilembus persalinus]|uniref:Uncharacterized protein n=1 Tax=Pseudocohnilembus persalinus TaxID=266149 RepID=A0A0V0R6I0_PSEPJ|nr:hypothetical protein PPERSA_08501 [Pseudocohnilembus persalinus]|eukprot:KRX10098.1 hypothetical protein PPERSA_08501 [Pseudocohnilembus persalinus]